MLKTSLLILLCLTIETETFSQITYLKNHLKFILESSSKLKNKLDLYQVDPTNGEDVLINKILNKGGHITYFPFKENGNIIDIHKDSLLPKVQELLNDFMKNNLEIKQVENEISRSVILDKFYKKLHLFKKEGITDSNFDEYLKTVSQIKLLPISKEMISLYLQYKELFNPLTVYNEKSIKTNCDWAKNMTSTISNTYEKAKAYSYIGDFAEKYQCDDIAIQMYYLSKESFQNLKNTRLKYSEQGDIEEKIANIFHQSRFAGELVKRITYYESAGEYYSAANDEDKANKIGSIMFGDNAYLFSDFLAKDDPTITSNFKLSIEFGLEEWFNEYFKDAASSLSNEENYYFLYSVATLLRSENKFEASLNYYLAALLCAAQTNNVNILQQSIQNVSYAYALLRKDFLSNAYSDLAIEFAKRRKNNFQYLSANLNKSYNYFLLKKYSKALEYINKVQFDDNINSTLPKSENEEIIFTVYRQKFKVLDSLKSDSARYYEQQFENRNAEYLNNFSGLLMVETDAIKSWLEHVKNEELFAQIEITKIANINKELEKSLKQKAEIKAIDVLIAKAHSDSINQIITIKNERLKKSESNLKKTVSQKVTAINWRNIVLGILAFSIIGLIISFQKNIKQNDIITKAHENETKQAEIIRTSLEKQLLLEKKERENTIALTIVKQTHDIKRLVSNVPEMIKGLISNSSEPSQIEKVKFYAENVSSYVKGVFESAKNPISTISEEIIMLKAYIETYKETKLGESYNVNLTNKIKDPYILNTMPIPSFVLNNFIKNSLEKGLAIKDQTEMTITISNIDSSNGYKIIIEDNGCGINYSKRVSGTKEGIGLKLVKEIIDSYNIDLQPFKINFSDSSIYDKEDKNEGTGTKVILEFIKN